MLLSFFILLRNIINKIGLLPMVISIYRW